MKKIEIVSLCFASFGFALILVDIYREFIGDGNDSNTFLYVGTLIFFLAVVIFSFMKNKSNRK